jgi:hypothetical protein
VTGTGFRIYRQKEGKRVTSIESETGWNREAKVRTEEKRNILPVYTSGG